MKDWSTAEEAKHLEARFKGVNQAEFARTFNVPGGPSMLSQHIKGRRPMNMDSALAYMKGFGVPLADISPRLAKQMSAALRELEASQPQGANRGSRGEPDTTASPVIVPNRVAVISANLSHPEAAWLVRMVQAADLPGVTVEVKPEWNDKDSARPKMMGVEEGSAMPAPAAKRTRLKK